MKRLFALCLLFCLLLGLTGCHKADPLSRFQVPETFDTSREYTITFWAKNESNVVQKAIYEQAIADFEALYPNIHVEMQIYTDYNRIYDDVITNLSTKTTPNVCITYPDHIATYMEGTNVVVPLDDLFAHEKYGLGGSALKYDGPTQDQIVSKFLAECAFDGSHYAIPYMRSTEVCYVNKTYVEKLGYTLPETLTWDFVWEVSAAAMEKDGSGKFLVNGQTTMIPFLYKSSDNMMIQMLRQAGGDYTDAAGQVLLFNDTTEELLRSVGDLASQKAFNTFSVGYPANFLNMGQCIFAIDSTAGATWMGPDAPLLEDVIKKNAVDYEIAVMALPQYDTENPQMISQGPSVCIFNKADPQEVLASWLFAQFLLTNDVQIAYSQTEGYLPVTTKALETEEYQTYLQSSGIDNDKHYPVKLAATRILLDNIDNTFVTPVFNGSTSVRQAAGEMIEQTKKAARQGTTLDDAWMEELFRQMTSQYHLDQIIPDESKLEGDKLVLPRSTEGPLPVESVLLLCTLGLTWVGIAVYLIIQRVKSKKILNSH